MRQRIDSSVGVWLTAGGNHWTCCVQMQSKNYKKFTKKKRCEQLFAGFIYYYFFVVSRICTHSCTHIAPLAGLQLASTDLTLIISGTGILTLNLTLALCWLDFNVVNVWISISHQNNLHFSIVPTYIHTYIRVCLFICMSV